MTRLRVFYSKIEADDMVLDFSQAEEDIGYGDVYEAVVAANPFEEIERESLDWEVLTDGD